MARRVHTENIFDDKGNHGDDVQYNLDELSEQGDPYGDEDDYGQEKEGGAGGGADDGAGDLINYKGIYFNDDPGQKF